MASPRTSIPALPDVRGDPSSADDLIAELRRVHGESVSYWKHFDTAAFYAPLAPGAWSAAEQVEHLTRSTRPVTLGLGLPRPLVALLFGRARVPSRSFSVLRSDYRAILAGGARAPWLYVPRPPAAKPQGEDARSKLMAAHAAAVDAFCAALGRWPDTALDTLRLPHPLLGRLTVREMATFTLYHHVHHVHAAERRRREGLGVAEPTTAQT